MVWFDDNHVWACLFFHYRLKLDGQLVRSSCLNRWWPKTHKIILPCWDTLSSGVEAKKMLFSTIFKTCFRELYWHYIMTWNSQVTTITWTNDDPRSMVQNDITMIQWVKDKYSHVSFMTSLKSVKRHIRVPTIKLYFMAFVAAIGRRCLSDEEVYLNTLRPR